MLMKSFFLVAGVSASLLKATTESPRTALLSVASQQKAELRATAAARAAILEEAHAKGQSYKEFMPTDDIDEYDYGGDEHPEQVADFSAHQFVVAKEEADEAKAENEADDDSDADEQRQIDADDEATNWGEDA